MDKTDRLFRSLLITGIFLQIIYFFFFKGVEWLFILAFFCTAIGVIYGMIQDWRAGNKGTVKAQLIAGGLFLLFISILIAIKQL